VLNLSGSEVIIILILTLVILGPEKLPEAMRRAGRAWGELRKLGAGFQDEVRKGFEEAARASWDSFGQQRANVAETRGGDRLPASVLEPGGGRHR